jgi:hypothetical protein
MTKTDTWQTRPLVKEGAPKRLGLDTKTYWLANRQSQCDFDFQLIAEYVKL